ncbi:hypothetical protein [Halomonas sp. PGE1]|uniref:hypothetical protein n=1 Tax=Halomonas sp. PGE1 TaxID=2730360 RepID=UPI00147446C5|nr:hypothetical protein [Halomonas sp. PGE1]QJQ98207.1 hypothetical protein HIR79_05575 [Halomonas sp. PGE1]
MGAALEVGAQWWDDRALAINSDGEHGRQELARACAEMWLAAVGVYFRDAQSAMRGIKTADLESLDDLTSDRRLLAALLEPLDADPGRIGDAMIQALDSGRRFDTGAMNRAVPEIHDDLRLGEWKEKHKRRGKAEAISLR